MSLDVVYAYRGEPDLREHGETWGLTGGLAMWPSTSKTERVGTVPSTLWT